MAEGQPDRKLAIISFLISAGTLASSPASTSFTLAPNYYVIDTIEALFPAGASQLTGFQWLEQGEVMLPWKAAGVFITGDNEAVTWDIGYQTSGQEVFQGYNLDVWDHTLTFRIVYHDVIVGSNVDITSSVLQPIA